jgi:hypothetical protein
MAPNEGIRSGREAKWELGSWKLYFQGPGWHLIELAVPGVWSVY